MILRFYEYYSHWKDGEQSNGTTGVSLARPQFVRMYIYIGVGCVRLLAPAALTFSLRPACTHCNAAVSLEPRMAVDRSALSLADGPATFFPTFFA